MLETAMPYGILIARLCLAAVFLYSGVEKAWTWRESVAEVKRLGLPQPELFNGLTVLTQLAGGLTVATGWNAAAGAILLAGFTAVATLLGHQFWTYRGVEARRVLTTALEHLAIIGGLLLFALYDLFPGH